MTDHTQDAEVSLPEVPSLTGFETPVSGAWANGWYRAIVVPSYTTRNGATFETKDVPNRDETSRNLSVATEVTDGIETRFVSKRINYRLSDFEPDRIATAKAAGKENAKVRGRWANADLQRTYLALVMLGQLEKTFGAKLVLNGGGIDVTPFIGGSADVYLGKNTNGYNEIRQFALSGTKVK